MNSRAARYSGADLAMFLFGLTGVVTGISGASILGLGGVQNVVMGATAEGEALSWGLVAFLGIGLLGVPAVYHGARGLFSGRRPAKGRPKLIWLTASAIFPLGVLGGLYATAFDVRPDLIMPVSHFLAMGSITLVVALIARRVGPAITSRRAWGQFLLGLWGAPPLALGLELVMLVPILVVGLLGLTSSPELQSILPSLMDPNLWQSPAFIDSLRPLVLRPFAIALGFVYLAILVPLIEEASKTIALWPFLRRGLTPAQAYLGGVLGGAGYALFEALLLSQGGSGWAFLVLGRSAATFMHAVTGGVTGWGLAQARRGKWKLFLLAYCSTIIAHGLWNSSSLGVGLVGLIAETEMDAAHMALASLSGLGGVLLLGTLSVLSIAALPVLGILIKKRESRPAES